jgi:hypothetical protein
MWWSVVLSTLGLVGMYLAGRRAAVGWAVSIANEVVWIVYGCVTGQWAFCLSAVAYGWVYVRNLRAWRAAPPATVRERMQ